VLLVVFGYLHWVSPHQPAPASAKSAMVAPAVKQPASPLAVSPPASAPTQQIPAEARRLPQSASDAPDSGPEGGSQELLLAEQRLSGKAGVRDSATAAKLLWIAVGKQNVHATLLLSDLYVRGDGVARNCDQARLLLVAAARKGGGPEAARQLRSLDSSGCR
jgi:TPR repeat protein